MVWKVVNKASPGDSGTVGSDDIDKISKLFNGTPNVDSVDMNSPFNFRHGKMSITNSSGVNPTTIVTTATAPRTLTLADETGLIVTDASALTLASIQTITGAKTYQNNTLKLLNPAGTFAYTLVHGPISANRNITIPTVTADDTLMTLGMSQTVTAQKTFVDDKLVLFNPAQTFGFRFRSTAITAARDVTLPALTANDTFVFKDHPMTLTEKIIDMNSGDLRIWNGGKTFKYTIMGGSITAGRQITLPLLTGDDTFMFRNHPETVTGIKTFMEGTLKVWNTAATVAATINAPGLTLNRTFSFPNVQDCDIIMANGSQNITGAKTFMEGNLKVRNTADSFSATINAPDILASKTYNLPHASPTTNNIATLEAVQTVTGAKTFIQNALKIQNNSGTFIGTINFAGGSAADRIFLIPSATADDTFMLKGHADTVTGVKTFLEGTMKIRNTADTFSATIMASGLTSNKNYHLPQIALNDINIATLEGSQTFIGQKTFEDLDLRLLNPAATFTYNFTGSAITSARQVILPLLTANDTFMFQNFAQPMSNKTVDGKTNVLPEVVTYPSAKEKTRVGGWWGGSSTAGFGFADGLITSIGTAASNILGTAAGKGIGYTTAATIDAQAGQRGGAGCGVMRTALGRFRAWFRQVGSPFDKRRLFIGLTASSSAFRTGDDPLNAVAGILLCERSTDTTYQIAHNDNTGATVFEDTGITFDGNMHTIEFKSDAADTGWQWSWDDGAFSAVITTDVSTTTTQLFPVIELETTEAVAKSFDFSYWFAEHTDLA